MGTSPMALGIKTTLSTIMQVPPHLRGLFTKELIMDILVYGSFIRTLALTNWVLIIYAFGHGDLATMCNTAPNNEKCSTVFKASSAMQMSFTWMIFIYTYYCRHLRTSLFTTKAGGCLCFYSNKVLVTSVFIGALVSIPTLYIPMLNTDIFKQGGLTREWIIVGFSLVVFIILSEIYKLLKRRFLTTSYNM